MMRYAVSPDGCLGEWWHSLDRPIKYGWHDCTDMLDDEFYEFVITLQKQ